MIEVTRSKDDMLLNRCDEKNVLVQPCSFVSYFWYNTPMVKWSLLSLSHIPLYNVCGNGDDVILWFCFLSRYIICVILIITLQHKLSMKRVLAMCWCAVVSDK